MKRQKWLQKVPKPGWNDGQNDGTDFANPQTCGGNSGSIDCRQADASNASYCRTKDGRGKACRFLQAITKGRVGIFPVVGVSIGTGGPQALRAQQTEPWRCCCWLDLQIKYLAERIDGDWRANVNWIPTIAATETKKTCLKRPSFFAVFGSSLLYEHLLMFI
jgi:hypothetical protein